MVSLPVGPLVKWCQFQELSDGPWCLQVGFAAAAAAKSALVSGAHAIAPMPGLHLRFANTRVASGWC